MDYRASLLALVETYCGTTGRSEARTANLAGSDGKFFARMREGKTCNVDTLHRIIQWFSDNWPLDAQWPVGVDRPIGRVPEPQPDTKAAA